MRGAARSRGLEDGAGGACVARACVGLALLVAASACSGSGSLGSLDQLLAGTALPGRAGLDEGTVVAGLKEALRVGTENTVHSTSRLGGFLDDQRIRIPLPEPLQPMARGLRAVGLGGQVDELEVAMNRAAERAAGEATPVFVGAIGAMSFADARGILDGGDTAATDYFRRTTSDELRSRFQPIVEEKMQEVGLARLYDGLVERYTALPFTTEPPLELPSYVTDRGLDGLFTVLAQEEQRIRTDPSARVTDLLQRVFGP